MQAKTENRLNRIQFLMECHSVFNRGNAKPIPGGDLSVVDIVEPQWSDFQKQWMNIEQPEETRRRERDERRLHNESIEFWQEFNREELAANELPITEGINCSLHQMALFIAACDKGEPIHPEGDRRLIRKKRKHQR